MFKLIFRSKKTPVYLSSVKKRKKNTFFFSFIRKFLMMDSPVYYDQNGGQDDVDDNHMYNSGSAGTMGSAKNEEETENEDPNKKKGIPVITTPSHFVREMTHGGEWYPTDQTLENWMKAAFYYAPCEESEKENLVGIIAPHSCYSVCLKTAAKAYARIDPCAFDSVIILGTCHNLALPACLISMASEVKTPFGNLTVDTNLCQQLVDTDPSLFSYMTEEVDNAEHSLEMQYPLIKYVFGDLPINIVPILVGSLNDEREQKITQILKPFIVREKNLFIISSDFTHWGELFRFTNFASMRKPLSHQPQLFDEKAMNIISGFNYEHFKFHIEEIKGSICGCYAICLILHILHKGYKAEKIDRTQLCQILCSTDFSISYMAVAFRVNTEAQEEEEDFNEDYIA
ncbi:hypothetical protein TRFO_11329 [Tritrichomonas foetus]|uniref:Memo-like protein n=1 Tax=Tritrichomonas foetus TaxID=1144522 RepID=A0A1J4J7N8_9EUKA|nr:hypothetical protein TRFO_11329 [Tritrichomonas foetus]|eukprot:OHS94239.1 hypothetical protein TRFO_11329 [Tritrichomonas foetus]